VRVRVPALQEHGGRDFLLTAQALDEPRLKVASHARFFAAR
jgi:hypothetical protein